jgi:hypothetical protein
MENAAAYVEFLKRIYDERWCFENKNKKRRWGENFPTGSSGQFESVYVGAVSGFTMKWYFSKEIRFYTPKRVFSTSLGLFDLPDHLPARS